MRLPLCKNLALVRPNFGWDGHTGLWFDKFFDGWDKDWQLSGKLASIQSIAGEPGNPRPCGSAALLDEVTMRQARLVAARGGRSGVFAAESRFVTGIGRSHPIENGFAWHAAYGVPYLPGSSVKGMTRAWAGENAARDLVDGMFGTPNRTGSIAFADALPIAPVNLDADVLTPHFAGWSVNEPPGDWLSPKPIPFLVMRARALFLFSLVPCRAVLNEDLDAIWSMVRESLAFAGAGAKTAVGYGRFAFDEARTRMIADRLSAETTMRRERAARERMEGTPEGRWSLKLRGLTEDQVLDFVRVHFEKEPLQDSGEAVGLARAIEATGFPAAWRLGNRVQQQTHAGSRKLKERAALIDRALANDNA